VKAMLGVLLGACCAVAIACGASRSRTAAAPQAADDGAMHADAHAEIDSLARKISDDLERAQVPAPAVAACTGTSCTTALAEPYVTPTNTDPQCHPASTDRCNDACTLSTSICGNQQKICDLAKQLDGDDWAANKCAAARTACRAAHDHCCRCVR